MQDARQLQFPFLTARNWQLIDAIWSFINSHPNDHSGSSGRRQSRRLSLLIDFLIVVNVLCGERHQLLPLIAILRSCRADLLQVSAQLGCSDWKVFEFCLHFVEFLKKSTFCRVFTLKVSKTNK
jgi:hypothetical protein